MKQLHQHSIRPVIITYGHEHENIKQAFDKLVVEKRDERKKIRQSYQKKAVEVIYNRLLSSANMGPINDEVHKLNITGEVWGIEVELYATDENGRICKFIAEDHFDNSYGFTDGLRRRVYGKLECERPGGDLDSKEVYWAAVFSPDYYENVDGLSKYLIDESKWVYQDMSNAEGLSFNLSNEQQKHLLSF